VEDRERLRKAFISIYGKKHGDAAPQEYPAVELFWINAVEYPIQEEHLDRGVDIVHPLITHMPVDY
jgi:hypothetical protein